MNKEHTWTKPPIHGDPVCLKCGQDWHALQPTAKCSCFKMTLPRRAEQGEEQR